MVRLVAVGYPGSVHVRDVGLKGHVDDDLWQYARGSGLVIVSKDTDFRERSYVEGFPPKVIWLDVGNAGTEAVAQLLTAEHDRKCRVCGSTLRASSTDLPFKVSDRTIVILKDLPVEQCEACSEYLIADAVFEKVEALLAGVDASVELEIIPFAA